MKEYIVHTSLSDEEFDKRAAEMDFSSMLRESAQFVYDDMMKQLHSIGKDTSDESISAARRDYGGAYDVDPEAFFTKEEMMEFADDTAVEISRKIGQNVLMEDVYIVDYNRVVIDFRIDDIEDIHLSTNFNIDMRRIRKPRDIYKYQQQVIYEIVSEYNNYADDVDVTSAAENPYENVPEDNEPEDEFDDSEEIDVHVDTGITVFNDSDWDYDSDTWSLNPKDRFGNWTSSKYPSFILAEPWYVREIADTLLSDHIPLDPGHYRLVADLKIHFDIENIQYWPEYSSKYVMDDANSMEDINKSEVVKIRIIPTDR